MSFAILVGSVAWLWRGDALASRLSVASNRYDALVSSDDVCVAAVWACKGKSCEAGNVASHTARGSSECWYRVGNVACVSDTATPFAIPLAIHAMRSLVQDTARNQHKPLRPFRSLLLAWATDGDVECVRPGLGSFVCPNCGAHNLAMAEKCISCGAHRPDSLPKGSLTLAVAPGALRGLPAVRSGSLGRALKQEEYGFRPYTSS